MIRHWRLRLRARPYGVLLLIACALAMRAALPAGWMPGAGAVLVPCDGAGPAAAMPHHGSRHGSRHRNTLGEHPCAFAVAVQAATDPEASAVLLPYGRRTTRRAAATSS